MSLIMKRCFAALLMCIVAFTVNAQKNKSKETFYIFKSDGQPAPKIEDAAYLGRLLKVSDTCWQWDLYNFIGPKIKCESYKDEKQTVIHGRQVYYNISGYFDSVGSRVNGILDGDWTYFNDTGRAIIKKEYDHGTLVSVTDLIKDSASQKPKEYGDERESSFPGGITKWQQYLVKNLNYPDRALKTSVMGEVIVQFMVNTDGSVEFAEIFKSVEYSLDEETLRLIRKSPKWTPGWQNGKHVKTYKKQPLRYKF